MARRGWREPEELIALPDVIRRGLGEVVTTAGSSTVIKVRSDNGAEVLFVLGPLEHKEWVKRRAVPHGETGAPARPARD
ncbi:MAG TPA: hypothetical protein VNT60_05065 [Deinococcales bacterium]|nr:hypothetical protein [Deinococcales bacterium]